MTSALEKKRLSRRKYYHKNKERILAQQRASTQERHKDPIAREKYCERQRVYLRNHYEARLLSSIRYKCKKDGIPFDLEVTDIVIPEVCPKTGILLVVHKEKGKFWDTPSVDRIDPKLGYIKSNIQIVSLWYNVAKLNWPEDVFIDMCKKVVSFHNG